MVPSRPYCFKLTKAGSLGADDHSMLGLVDGATTQISKKAYCNGLQDALLCCLHALSGAILNDNGFTVLRTRIGGPDIRHSRLILQGHESKSTTS
eukprot:CAMPEP_0177634112 /NCGR_PEP_ID=MMETSP0447-20121125/3196_1 /TAXON_ID=0 /ORGANISM="Stygamoeba regulata, Strain BSH-02190019" /LENGTH=94 /DNA_ID=CAMNT_0019135815 /DNA_START=608 /DNA_END=888 /DNA_ORIENTATION=+